jgi:transcriptional regulator with XRE-family HTH domain
MPERLKYIGERLKKLRKRNNYSQQYVADTIGISRSTYTGYEREYNPPDVLTLVKLAKLYNCSTDSILLGFNHDLYLPVEFKRIIFELKPEDSEEFWDHLLDYAKFLAIYKKLE